MLAITKHMPPTDNSDEDVTFITVNGVPDLKSRCYDTPLGGGLGVAGLDSKEVIDIICSASFTEVARYFSHIYFDLQKDFWIDSYIEVNIFCYKYFDYHYPSVKLRISTDPDEGAYAWNGNEFNIAFKVALEQMNYPQMLYCQENESSVAYGFGIMYHVASPELIIKNEIERICLVLEKCIFDADKILRS